MIVGWLMLRDLTSRPWNLFIVTAAHSDGLLFRANTLLVAGTCMIII